MHIGGRWWQARMREGGPCPLAKPLRSHPLKFPLKFLDILGPQCPDDRGGGGERAVVWGGFPYLVAMATERSCRGPPSLPAGLRPMAAEQGCRAGEGGSKRGKAPWSLGGLRAAGGKRAADSTSWAPGPWVCARAPVPPSSGGRDRWEPGGTRTPTWASAAVFEVSQGASPRLHPPLSPQPLLPPESGDLA